MEDGIFTIPVGEAHFDINLRTLAQVTVELQILVNRQNGNQKAGPFESITAKFSQSRHGSFEWNIFLRYLSKFSDIWHFTKCKIQGENCRNTPAIRSWNFSSSQCKQLINMHELCPNMANPFLQFTAIFKMAVVSLDIYIWGPWPIQN